MLICLGYKGLLSSLCSGSFTVALYLETCFIEHPWKFLPLVKNFLSHFLLVTNIWIYSFPGVSVSKESACNARDPDSVLEFGKIRWRRKGNPLQYSCLGNLLERGVWRATIHGAAKSIRHDFVTKPPLPFEHSILHKNLVGSQSAHVFCAWRTKSSLIPSGHVHQQWEAGSGVGWWARDERWNGVLLGPTVLLNPRGLLLMRVMVIQLKKTCQDPFFLCSLKNVFFPSRCPFYELEKVLIKETSSPV